MLRGVKLHTSNVPSERKAGEWLDGDPMDNKMAGQIVRFVLMNPDPGLYIDWEERVSARSYNRMEEEERLLQARRDTVARERMDRQTTLLAAENVSRMTAPWCPSMRNSNRGE